MDIEKYRKLFPITQKWIYLNHAGTSPLPRPVVQAMTKHLEDTSRNGSIHGKYWIRDIQKARELAARLINGSPPEIAFIRNTSEGLSWIANGIRWNAGENLITANVEYPANVYPWLNISNLGVETRFVKEREGKIYPEDIEQAIDPKTRLLAISSVEFSSGYRNDLKLLGNLCRQKNILFVVDAIQSLGAFPLDVQQDKIDILAAGAQKWLLGPAGVGILYCRREILDQIRVTVVGADSVINAEDYLNYDFTLKPDSTRFESGTGNRVGLVGLKASLELLFEVDCQEITQRILQITEYFCSAAQCKGYHIYSPRGEGEKSGIISFYHDKYRCEEIRDFLRGYGVFTVIRDHRLRISPHFYNTIEEMAKVIHLLP